MTPPPPIPVVILAAGGSRRLGTAKQLVRFRGRTLLGHAVATARASGCAPVLVVLGAADAPLRRAVADAGARPVENPDWATGLASSVRAGVAAVAAEVPAAGAALFLVCDQPLLTPDLLAAIAAAHRAGHDLVAAEYDGVAGVPALFGRRFFGELAALAGDVGARRVLARHAAEVHAIPFAGGMLDVDTPADVARLADLADPIDLADPTDPAGPADPAPHPSAATSPRGDGRMATAPAEIETPTLAVGCDATCPVTLDVNGATHRLDIEPSTVLLDLLRNTLGLTGSKKGCDHGQCGACTVLIDGRGCNSCLLLAVMQDGKRITTIEGVARGDQLHPLQAAFIEHDAFQCGYCTPGQICSAIGLINEGRARTAADIRELMSGNLCRCAAYPNIVRAVEEVLRRAAEGQS